MRSDQYEDGRANGIRKCIAWLHAEARAMNDPKAAAILNTAAFGLGVMVRNHTKRARETAPNNTPTA